METKDRKQRVMLSIHPEMAKQIELFHKNLLSNGLSNGIKNGGPQKITRTKASGILGEIIRDMGIPYSKVNIIKKAKRREEGILIKL